MLNLARGAQGVGGAAMFSTSLALLGSSFQGRERGVAFGVWGAITGLAVAIGPVIGGGLTSGLSWRWIFLVNVPIGVIAVLISLMRVEETKMPRARKPDLIGVVTFSGALAALVYALIKGDSKGWTSPVILGCLIGAGVLMILFLIAERVQGDGAMFDLSLFRKPTFTGGSLAAFGLSGGLFALFLYLTLYLQDVLGYSAIQTGLRFLFLSGGILLTSALAGRLTTFVPIRFLIAPGLLMVGIGVLLMRGVTAGTGWSHLVPGFILAGAGTGFVNPPLASTAIGVVRAERAGMASGINSTFRQVGIATGIAGLGAIFSHQVRTKIESLLSGSSQLGPQHAHALAASVASGSGAKTALRSLPPSSRGIAIHALKAAFASGLNEVFLVGGILSLAAAVLSLVLIRSKDFEVGAARTVPPPDASPAPAGEPGPPAPAPTEPSTPAAATDSAAQPVELGAEEGAEAVVSPSAAVVPPADAGVPVDGAATVPPAAVAPEAPVEAAEAPVGLSEELRQQETRGDNGSDPQVEVENSGPVAEETGVGQRAAPLSTGAGTATATLQQRMASYSYHPRPPVPPPPPPPALSSHASGLGTSPGSENEPDPGAKPDPGAPSAHGESAAAPEPSRATEPSRGPEFGGGAPVPEVQSPDPGPATSHETSSSAQEPPSEPVTSGQEGASDLPNVQDMPVSSDPPAAGAPNTHDVRLVMAAVQSAEEAALAYAREIGEARSHLSAAIEHLDRAEEARALLNRYAAGFTSPDQGQDRPAPQGMPTPQDQGGAASPASGSGETSDRPTPASPAPGVPPAFPDQGGQRPTGPMTTPSPGIAIAGQNPATPNPPGSPPPRPAGWGPGAGGSRER
jgi:EmrB/QacA subfamily drug resistance transporter